MCSAARLKAVAHPVRLAILQQVEHRPRRVSDIAEALGLPQAVVSQHLSVLRTRGVLKAERRGNEVLYDPQASSMIGILDCIRKSMCAREGPITGDPADAGRHVPEVRW